VFHATFDNYNGAAQNVFGITMGQHADEKEVNASFSTVITFSRT